MEKKNHLVDQQQCTRYQDMCQFIQAIKPHLVQQLQPELPPGYRYSNALSFSKIYLYSAQAK